MAPVKTFGKEHTSVIGQSADATEARGARPTTSPSTDLVSEALGATNPKSLRSLFEEGSWYTVE